MYGPSDETESIATIHAALDQGITLLDTGDFYGMGHNELLIGRALRGHRDKALLSVKFGAMRSPDGSWIGYDARPARGIMNRVMRELGPLNDLAPAFPLAAAAMAPLRAKAEAAGSGDFSPLWFGQNATCCREIPASELTRELACMSNL